MVLRRHLRSIWIWITTSEGDDRLARKRAAEACSEKKLVGNDVCIKRGKMFTLAEVLVLVVEMRWKSRWDAPTGQRHGLQIWKERTNIRIIALAMDSI